MSLLVLFFVGLPAAFVAQRLIQNLSNVDDLEYAEESSVRRRLPWQTEQGVLYIAWGAAVFVVGAFVLAGLIFDLVEALVVAFVITALLICVATDLLSYRVPDVITYPATILAMVAAFTLPDANLASALAAAVLGGGIFLVMYLVAPRGGFGFGDVKLAVLIGAALGLPGAYYALVFGMLGAAVVIVPLLVIGVVSRRQAVPYAPFLALSASVFLLVEGAAFAPL
jgi:leader peptidase (prepilin peptidase)/N-methyltransferase